MAFEDWFIARASVSSKPHRKITLDDKMTFFQQLSTLVSSGTPLLQASPGVHQQNQSTKLQLVLDQVASRGVGQFRAHGGRQLHQRLPTSLDRSHSHGKSPDKWPWSCSSSTSRLPTRGPLPEK